MRPIVFLAAMAVLATGCVQTNAVRLGPSPSRAAVPEAEVFIYRTAEQVPRRYEEVALLNSTGESNWTNEAAMFKSMQKKAGGMGANGIILDAVNEAGAGAKVAAAIFGVGTQRKGKAIAIYVFPEGVRADSTQR